MDGNGNYMLKQYLRWLPAQLGLFSKGAFLLQIDRIDPDDIFICSWPKSGNTWLRFLVANMMEKKEEISFRNIDRFVPDIYTSKKIINASKKGRRIIKTHQPLFDYYPKMIYICRDYRDVLVSYYHYQKALGIFTDDFEHFVFSKHTRFPFGTWKDHVNGALQAKEKKESEILFMRYEDLFSPGTEQLEKVASFCGLKPAGSLAEIAEKCSFTMLRKNENEKGSRFRDRSGENFFRSGKSGSWKDYFPDELLAKILADSELSAVMKKLAYI